MLYKFALLSPHSENFVREIEIDSNATLLTFHEIIQQSVGYHNDELASFFTTNNDWEQLEEITLLEMDENDLESDRRVMDVTCLYEVVSEEKDKLLYFFDLLNRRAFFIELVIIRPGNFAGVARCYNSEGEAPPQMTTIEFDEALDSDLSISDMDKEEKMTFENIDDYDM